MKPTQSGLHEPIEPVRDGVLARRGARPARRPAVASTAPRPGRPTAARPPTGQASTGVVIRRSSSPSRNSPIRRPRSYSGSPDRSYSRPRRLRRPGMLRVRTASPDEAHDRTIPGPRPTMPPGPATAVRAAKVATRRRFPAPGPPRRSAARTPMRARPRTRRGRSRSTAIRDASTSARAAIASATGPSTASQSGRSTRPCRRSAAWRPGPSNVIQ